jgi:branched-chain amino acid aminotransferase
MDLARARQIKVVERAIMPEELARTEEVFLTGSAAEVTPVSQIGEYGFTPGRICRQMVEDYAEFVTSPGKWQKPALV